MYKMSIAVLAGSLGLAASANVAAGGLFSRTGPVIAIMADDLFLGEAEGDLSGAGTIAIRSQRNPDVTCAGQFTSSAELGGSGQMQCSNGTAGTYHFKRLSLEKGYGNGRYGRDTMSFTYGLTHDESKPYLKLPRGTRLESDGKALVLVDVLPKAPQRPVSPGSPKTQPG